MDLLNSLQWRHNGSDGVSNNQPHDCLLNRLFRIRSKKTLKLCVTGLYEGNSPETGEFPAQRASNAKNISISWRHHAWAIWRGINHKNGWITFCMDLLNYCKLYCCHMNEIIKEWEIFLSWWRHDIEKLSTLPALCEGNQPKRGRHGSGALFATLPLIVTMHRKHLIE